MSPTLLQRIIIAAARYNGPPETIHIGSYATSNERFTDLAARHGAKITSTVFSSGRLIEHVCLQVGSVAITAQRSRPATDDELAQLTSPRTHHFDDKAWSAVDIDTNEATP